VGDLLEATVEKGKITLTPKSLVDRDIAEGLEDFRQGHFIGPFKSAKEGIRALRRAARPNEDAFSQKFIRQYKALSPAMTPPRRRPRTETIRFLTLDETQRLFLHGAAWAKPSWAASSVGEMTGWRQA